MGDLRLGAFGGTFDPIHNGHIQVAREVARRFSLDRVLMIPAATPPHKNLKSIADAYHRHAMTVLAAYGRQEVLEGPPVEGIVIVEFPSIEDAKAWYDSPAYREAREHRFRGARYRAIIVEGLV